MNMRYERKHVRLPPIIDLINYLEELAIERGRLEERLSNLQNNSKVEK